MRLTLLKIFLFLVANVLVIVGLIKLFQSSWPFSAWFALGLYNVVLILFPYNKLKNQ
jgi:hypothetical protein